MRKEKNTLVRWFGWWGWYPDKLEAWLEAKAAEGWHLEKADRILLRFHFRRGAPRIVRICADWPANPSQEYRTIFGDAGWELVAERGGWYIWRTEYSGAQRPEIFNDVDGLIERNQRFLTIFLAALAAQIPFWALNIRRFSFASTASKVFLAFYTVLMAIIVISLIATSKQLVKLKSRKR